MADIDTLYADTEKYLNSLEVSYLSKHLADPTTTPIDYDLDVKSYCILCHAAFEEFVEGVVIEVMIKTIDNFINHHTLSESIISLMHFKSSGETYLNKQENDDNIEIISSFDYIRKKLPDIKDRFSKEIFNNHGVGLKYIKQLLMPIAVDIPSNTMLLSSLSALAKERGSYAHKFLEKGTIRKSIAPEDAKAIVNDCIKFFYEIKEKAKARI